MLPNNLKIAWRNLFRNKLHSAINIGGLIIGFTIGIADILIVFLQFQTNHQYDGKRLYEVYTVAHDPAGDVYENSFSLGPGPAYKAEAPAIQRMTRIGDGGNHIEYKGRDISIPLTTVDEDFLSMFSFPVVKGRGADALRDLTDAVVTEETAKTIFGNEDPIGKHIRASVGDRMQDLVVSAVVKDPVRSTIRFQVLARLENAPDYARKKNNWEDHSVSLYVQLKESAGQRLAEGQLREADRKHVPDIYTDLRKKGAKPDALGDVWATRLLPMKDVYFNTTVNGHRATSVSEVLISASVGLFIILIACFNFVNISLAGAFTRSREMGVRKCLGAQRWRLFGQLWGESMLVCVLSFALSLVLLNILLHSFPAFQVLRISLADFAWRPGFIGLMAGLLLFVSLMAGGYPALVMIRFKVVETLKGNVKIHRRSPLRRSLIVLQFVIACVTISCTFILYRQYRFLAHADLGMAKETIISVPLHSPAAGHAVIARLRTRLAADPRIVSVSGSNINLGRGSDHRTVKIGTNFPYHGRDVSTLRAWVDYDYLKTIGVKPLAGRDFDPAYGTDTTNGCIISESMAKSLGDSAIVGKTIYPDSADKKGWHIVGVFPDFHLYTMAEQMEPLTLSLDMNAQIPYVFIKTTGRDMLGAMATIKREMAELEPGQDFNGSFVDDNVEDWYKDEKGASLIFSIAATISIALSCSGLLAMVLLMIQRRVKEIGVRKVLGASVRSISVMVSREFIALVGLAVAIATPISWLLMDKFLQHYPYRIDITVGMFLLVGATAIGIAVATIAFNTVRAARQNPVKALRTE
ncbi:MAG TPA: FtsX-like permease family protein [Puia sp.]|uniref:ABC transporter permease n=1 Tax=Puia sp. TaxID=2045100 RepID=UPI002D19E129|nr:FtsX-like permease family protein [Puia sp.]HVU97850.1 FtsX-like permease family protein [Puia sp.]